MKNDYNGWKNRQTWNIALWINNDESLYRIASQIAREAKENRIRGKLYGAFIRRTGLRDCRTPDNISYTGTRLDYKSLNEMIAEIND